MRRRNQWLLAAAVLLALAAYLMSRQGQAPDASPRAQVEFPRRLRAPEFQRMEKRKTLPPLPSAALASAQETRRRDPLISALPGNNGGTVLVIEANAIRHSPIGELLVQCFAARGRGDPVAQFQEQTGIDLLKDLDRIAITEKGMIVSGSFQNARWDKTFGEARASSYGEQGAIYSPAPHSLPDGGPAEPMMGIWNGQLIIIGENGDDVRSAVDRVEGRAPVRAPALPEESSYGEIYGVISAEQLAPLISGNDLALAERLRRVAERIEIHVDTRKDVALAAHVSGRDAAAVSDLGKSLGAMLSLARLHPEVRQNPDLAELLDLARIEPGDGHFDLELALPMEFLEKQLASCRGENPARAVSVP